MRNHYDWGLVGGATAIKDNPDLQVAGEDGKPESAVEELNKSLDTLKQDDGELAKVALACAGRA